MSLSISIRDLTHLYKTIHYLKKYAWVAKLRVHKSTNHIDWQVYESRLIAFAMLSSEVEDVQWPQGYGPLATIGDRPQGYGPLTTIGDRPQGYGLLAIGE